MKGEIISIIILYFLAVFQTSFFVPNLILILVVLVNFFEKKQSNFGFWVAFWGGFFLDIFSAGFLGTYTLLALGIAIFLKMILRKYVWSPSIQI